MTITAGRAMACAVVLAMRVAAMTECQPLDANPSHVTIVDSIGTDHFTLQNRTGYSVRIDHQEISQTSLSFTPTTILPGQDATAGPAYASVAGITSVKVSFTLIGARNRDGSPVTGTAVLFRSSPIIS